MSKQINAKDVTHLFFAGAVTVAPARELVFA